MLNLFAPRSVSITLRYIITIAFLFSVVSCSTNNIHKNSRASGQTTSSQHKKVTYFNEPLRVIEEYVNRVGKRLIIVADDITTNYHFKVSSEVIPNVWVNTPTEITITKGMLQALDNEAQLAALLAHEIFHAAQGGYREKIYSTDELLTADAFSVQHLIAAGFDPKAALELQALFAHHEQNEHSLWQVGYLSTHANSAIRSNYYKKASSEFPRGLELGQERYVEELFKLSHG